ncbi:hypothetical protein [Thermococcus barossii]|uniref:Uncharacterized protein n=1 Tax=Thermococcus barossii TaxID=54077 RepID=A0A2Z2MHX7_9EURY|nr:hypothetical protein [Thermococcus barossii]ASJ05516.1 hypothetical protein A3L01_09135 [Thermococcus barossii]
MGSSMACEELIRKLALGFALMFVSGFLILYYAIRKLACASTNLCSVSHWPETPAINSVDMLVVAFVVTVLFISFVWYSSYGGKRNES